MAIKRTYVYRDGKIVEVNKLKNQHKLYPADKAVMVNRDAIMSMPEARHMAGETIDKMKKQRRTCYDDIRR